MAINTKIQSQIAFKRLAGNVVLTNPDASAYEEVIGSSVQLSSDVIFGEKIPSAPGVAALFDTASNSAGVGVVQLVKFDLVEIGSSQYDADSTGFGTGTANQFDSADSGQSAGKHAFALRFTSDYQSQGGTPGGANQNPRAGTGFFVNNKELTGSLGQVQIVPPRYGTEYIPTIKNESGVPLDIGGAAQDFYLDTFAGVLFRQDVNDGSDFKPNTLEAYVYIGKMASESLADTGAEGLGPTLIAGNTAENDIILTGSLIVTSSAGATDTVDFSGVNNVTASFFNVTENADIDGNLNVDGTTQLTGNTTITNDLTVDGNVVLGNSTSDIVTVAGDLIVNGDVTNVNTANLLVEDPFILLNSQSAAAGDLTSDGGIIVQTRTQGSIAHGTALFYDSSKKAWGITGASGSAAAPNTVAHNDADGVEAQVNIATIEIKADDPIAEDILVPKIGATDNDRYGQLYVDTSDDAGGLYIYLPGTLG